MRDHAEDALELLAHLGGGCCHAALGWSTGVQVLLEMAAIKPNAIGRLVLVNGAHGHVFQSVAQPIIRVPGFCYIAHSLAQLFRHPKVMPIAMSLYGSCLPIFRTCLLKPMAFMLGINYEAFFHNYLKEVMYGEKHTANYFKLAACLDAHSCYHVLDEIRQPTLIFAGMLDVLVLRLDGEPVQCVHCASCWCGQTVDNDNWTNQLLTPLNAAWLVVQNSLRGVQPPIHPVLVFWRGAPACRICVLALCFNACAAVL